MEIREQRPSYVTFERRPVEDRAESIKQGRYMTKDVDFAIVTPIGSKDRIPRQVDDWFKQMEQQVREERIPPTWLHQYRQSYEAWKAGQDPVLNGTPIKGWQVLSPAQQSNIISANVLTVEDLAQVNDEAARRIGMGALEFRDKAIAWLKAAKNTGVTAQEVTALQAKVRLLEEAVKAKDELIAQLKAENDSLVAKKGK